MYDYETIRTHIEAIVETYGDDFKYVRPGVDEYGEASGSCAYVHSVDGEFVCGCIIGHLFHRLGLISLESLYDTTANQIGVGGLARELGLHEEFTGKAMYFMKALQEYQDQNGTTWGHALREATMSAVRVSEDGFRISASYTY